VAALWWQTSHSNKL